LAQTLVDPVIDGVAAAFTVTLYTVGVNAEQPEALL
jgi:Asp/Glu/hydantoin racemase